MDKRVEIGQNSTNHTSVYDVHTSEMLLRGVDLEKEGVGSTSWW